MLDKDNKRLVKKNIDNYQSWVIKHKHKYLVGIGSLIILIGILSSLLNWIQSSIGATLISLGITIFIIGTINKIRKNKLDEKDERIKKISLYSLSYSWILTIFVMLILLWLNLSGVYAFKGLTFFFIDFFVMLISFYFFQYYFQKKGRLE
jgi:uncharacterized membrane protein YidH (DUF202 family)